jgi:hypothetical protein
MRAATCSSGFARRRERSPGSNRSWTTNGTAATESDAFLTDEFGGTNFPLIHAVLQGPRIVRHRG